MWGFPHTVTVRVNPRTRSVSVVGQSTPDNDDDYVVVVVTEGPKLSAELSHDAPSSSLSPELILRSIHRNRLYAFRQLFARGQHRAPTRPGCTRVVASTCTDPQRRWNCPQCIRPRVVA